MILFRCGEVACHMRGHGVKRRRRRFQLSHFSTFVRILLLRLVCPEGMWYHTVAFCRKTGNRSKGRHSKGRLWTDVPTMRRYFRRVGWCLFGGVPRAIPLGIPVASTERARAPPFCTRALLVIMVVYKRRGINVSSQV